MSICSLISHVFLVGIMAAQGELVMKWSAAQAQSLSICSLISPVFLVGIMAVQGELVTKSSAAQVQSLSICSLISPIFLVGIMADKNGTLPPLSLRLFDVLRAGGKTEGNSQKRVPFRP